MSLLSRVIAERRAVVIPLVLALAANAAVYVLIVRPLGIKSSGAEGRAVAARAAREAAERDLAQARRLVSGKADADNELVAFYRKVLPQDLVAARRMTYASLPALARQAGVRYDARTTTIEPPEKDATLGHMTIRMLLRGDYVALREFIYALERAPEFVILDDVTLTEADEGNELTLSIDLSTYYVLRANGS
jgi:hypothetical protein